jgi:hypothetical protein
VTDFALLTLPPHVWIGGPLTTAQNLFTVLAGSGAMLIAWLGWTVIGRRRIRRADLFTDALSLLAAIELAGWACSAWSYRAGQTNDAARFLRLTGWHPSTVIAACVLLALAGVAVARLTRPVPLTECLRLKTPVSSRVEADVPKSASM